VRFVGQPSLTGLPQVARHLGASISGNPAQAIILKCDCNAEHTHTMTPLRRGFLRSMIRWLVIGLVLLWSLAALILVAARWIDPPTNRGAHAAPLAGLIHHTPYRERYKFIPLSQISPDLQHAVIAAEDAHFYQHHGFDWHEIQIAAEDIWKAIALAELPPLRSNS